MGDDAFMVQMHVNANGGGGDGTPLEVRRGWSLGKLKKAAGKATGVKRPRKIFTDQGREVTGVDEIQLSFSGDATHMYVSGGEPFFGGPGALAAYSPGPKAAPPVTKSISVLGVGGVGKSALTLRFVRQFFQDVWDPTIETAFTKDVDIEGQRIHLEILDTAGQEDYKSLRPEWMGGKDGYIFVYSMADAFSLDELKPYYDLSQDLNAPGEYGEAGRHVPIVLVANKKDMCAEEDGGDPELRKVSRATGEQRARDWGAQYIETSAKTSENVEAAFTMLVTEALRQKEPEEKKDGCCTIL